MMWKFFLRTAFLGLICQYASLQPFQWSRLQKHRWGPWSEWLPCSKPCGGGTRIRLRQCISPSRDRDLPKFILKVYKQPKTGNCRGTDTQYITCNLQDCPKSKRATRQRAVEARAKQCRRFNGTSFNGHFFNWVPYLRVKDSEECELNCLAKGHKFFLRLLPKVEDGTPCLTDVKNVCINGKCQAPPPECEDGSCFGKQPTKPPKQRRAGIFTSEDVSSGRLILGYNPVITIPAGATNINVTESQKSKNYLALKSHHSNKYYINGNWVIDLPKGYKVAGTIFFYTRPHRNERDNEAFISAGPTTEDLDIMLLYQDDEPFIKYSYLLPKEFPRVATQPQQPADPVQRGVHTLQPTTPGTPRYVWHVAGFTQCSHSCAGGTQTTVYQCITLVDRTVVDQSICPQHLRPTPRQRACKLQPCPPRWEPGQWGKCSTTCGPGLQIRSLLCKQLIDKNGKREERMLPINYCRQWERPVPSQSCNLTPCPPPTNWTVGEWSKCSVSCEQGIKQRNVQCVDINNVTVDESKCRHNPKPSTTKPCSAGSCNTNWYASQKWSHCSVPCGRGQQTRLIICGRKGGDSLVSGHCSRAKKPSSTRPCTNGKCMAIWVASEWSECSVMCGTGTQFRSVFCAGVMSDKYQEYPDEACPRSSKPAAVQQCSNDFCKPEWFTTQWGQCSRSCGSGSQFREVMCMDHTGQVSNNCNIKEKPYHYQRCNNIVCPTTSPGKLKDKTPCQDTYSNNVCVYVRQANFCQFSHYRKMCCNSCARRL